MGKTRIEIADIVSAILDKRLIQDSELRFAKLKYGKMGQPMRYVGGFSVVFPYDSRGGQTKAFRCWHINVPDAMKRYQIMSKDLKKARLPYFCDFEYIPKALCVNEEIIPATRMQWIDGKNIKDYICEYRGNRKRLLDLADKFQKMTYRLHLAHIAHGDLQHGNILVDSDGELRLIDYDSLITPSMKNLPDEIKGLPGYQHPQRGKNKYENEKLDYFSEVVIYLSIVAIAYHPELIDKYKVDDADRLLFDKKDFEDVDGTEIWSDLKKMRGDVPKILKILRTYLSQNNINDLEPIEKYLFEPELKIWLSSSILRKGKPNDVTVYWATTYSKEVTLSVNGEELKVKPNGQRVISCKDSLECVLQAKAIYGGGKYLNLARADAVEECVVKFDTDRHYTFPGLPIRLAWNVEHGDRIMLRGYGVVAAQGSREISVDRDTTFTLNVEDAFGRREFKCMVKTLPIPQIKTVMVPAPDLTVRMPLQVTMSRAMVDVKIPDIGVDTVDITAPMAHVCTDIGAGIKIRTFSPIGLKTIGRAFGRLYNRIIKHNKITNNE